MDKLKDINDQLRLKNLELSIERDYKKKQEIKDAIQVLQFKKQIEDIRIKIRRMSR